MCTTGFHLRKIVFNISLNAEAPTGGVLYKKVFLEILQNSQEYTRRVSFLVKLLTSGLLKKRLWHMCFTVHSVKFLRTHFL